MKKTIKQLLKEAFTAGWDAREEEGIKQECVWIGRSNQSKYRNKFLKKVGK